MKQYKTVVSGGTFDLFHKGHEQFLHEQLVQSETVIIGVTSDTYTKVYKDTVFQPFQERLASVIQFLKRENVMDRVIVESIDTPFIPDKWDTKDIDAIFVTQDTKKGAEIINKKRQTKGLPTLAVILVPYVLAEDGRPISSSRIRSGDIDREGHFLISSFWESQTLQLPKALRDTFHKPLGSVFSTIENLKKAIVLRDDILVTVGDVVSEAIYKSGYKPHSTVVDLFVQRKQVYTHISEHSFLDGRQVIESNNPAGTITPSLWKAVGKSIQSKEKSLIFVKGEEDLAVVPLVLYAPLGFQILYGQPHEGIVVVEVTEEKKKYIKKLVEQFVVLASK